MKGYWVYKKYTFDFIDLLLNLKEGDLLEIDRRVYKHWAVYIGDGKVIHKVDPEEFEEVEEESGICQHELMVCVDLHIHRSAAGLWKEGAQLKV